MKYRSAVAWQARTLGLKLVCRVNVNKDREVGICGSLHGPLSETSQALEI